MSSLINHIRVSNAQEIWNLSENEKIVIGDILNFPLGDKALVINIIHEIKIIEGVYVVRKCEYNGNFCIERSCYSNRGGTFIERYNQDNLEFENYKLKLVQAGLWSEKSE